MLQIDVFHVLIRLSGSRVRVPARCDCELSDFLRRAGMHNIDVFRTLFPRLCHSYAADGLLCCVELIFVFGRPYVIRFALCYRTVVCLSVTFVYCGQTVGLIRMPRGMQVGLVPFHIVLDGTQLLPQEGA